MTTVYVIIVAVVVLTVFAGYLAFTEEVEK